ncbi:sugar-transfer associated ATP-grasp domain-containing protein [uncultured Kriegella sp.]|uniref:sugar-transfer associated ATP-grasp domain-containing protein n=1 Tax=uncultured Kriegella sp. TaxID=1798910 RepID=UPI0030DD927D|tara:strand:- start:147373 stop:148443 length:1071 start_codon:yes stop_codon:yes gene_type:complete
MKIIYFIIYLSLKIYKKTTKISHNITWKNKIKKLIKTKGAKKLTNTQIAEIRSYYDKYKMRDVSTEWHRFYFSGNNSFAANYVPENLFYIDIEPRLNKSIYFPSLSDKNLLDRLFPKVRQPETVLKNINGFFYANGRPITFEKALSLADTEDRLVIKPTLESGGGKNVMLFSSKKGVTTKNLKLTDVFLSYGEDFIIQKEVKQHVLMKSLNPTSLNTLRIMTYLNENNVDVLSTIVRIGRKGSSTDNATTGGISCGIQKNGQFNALGYQLSGNSFSQTDSGVKFEEVRLEFIEKVFETVKELHHKAAFFRLISWDLAINDEEQIVLIEYNVMGQGINSHQLNNGPVLSPLLKTLAI